MTVDPAPRDDCDGVERITWTGADPAGIDTANLTAGTRAALACLRAAVSRAGGMLVVASAYRSAAYQNHLREVWDKYQIVRDWPTDKCAEVQSNVRAEWDRHDLVYRPAERSRHSSGRAFDANWGTLNEGEDIDDLAEGCSLSRPVRGDPTHFEHGG